MDINYKQKYLKYKLKYLGFTRKTGIHPTYDEQQNANKKTFEDDQLKNDNKPQDIFVLGTHGKRMLCSLKEYGINLLKIQEIDKNRFMNCSMVEVYLLPNSDICCISLVYNGELEYNKAKKAELHEKYFISDNLPKPSVPEGIKNSNLYIEFKPQYIKLKSKFKKPNKPTRIIIGRHGDGHHTAAKKDDKFWSLVSNKDNNEIFDSNLTSEGEGQGANAAAALIEHLGKIKYDQIYFGASDLLRAIRTINIYLKKYNESFTDKKDTVNIVPCSHEIGECGDGIIAWGLNKVSNENKTICGYKGERQSVGKNLIQQKQKNSDTCEKIDGINIKWSIYDKLFDNVKRGDFNGTTICSKKNMIDFVVENLQVSKFI
jgi:hypothetical protein